MEFKKIDPFFKQKQLSVLNSGIGRAQYNYSYTDNKTIKIPFREELLRIQTPIIKPENRNKPRTTFYLNENQFHFTAKQPIVSNPSSLVFRRNAVFDKQKISLSF